MSEASIAAGKANIRSFADMPPEEMRALARRGGRSKSIAKSEGAKLRHIKERIASQVANPKDAEWLLQKLNDRPSMAADLLLYIEKLAQEGAIHPAQRVALAGVMSNAMKAVHGDKIKVESVNINVNTTVEEWERRIASLIDKV